jgi:hypothetical protein
MRKSEGYDRIKAQSDTIILSFLVTAATMKFLSEDDRFEVICHQLSLFPLVLFALYSYFCKISNVYCKRVLLT